jgi:hypothetical protein
MCSHTHTLNSEVGHAGTCRQRMRNGPALCATHSASRSSSVVADSIGASQGGVSSVFTSPSSIAAAAGPSKAIAGTLPCSGTNVRRCVLPRLNLRKPGQTGTGKRIFCILVASIMHAQTM